MGLLMGIGSWPGSSLASLDATPTTGSLLSRALGFSKRWYLAAEQNVENPSKTLAVSFFVSFPVYV